MNLTTVVYLILIPALSLLMIIMLILFLANKKINNNKKNIFNQLESKLENKKIIFNKFDVVEKQITRLSNKNDSYKPLEKKVKYLLDKADEFSEDISNDINKVKNNITTRNKSFDFDKNIYLINKKFKELDLLIVEFEKTHLSFTKKDEILRLSLSTIKKLYKNVLDIYNHQKLNINEIISNVDLKIQNIEVIKNEFEDQMSLGNLASSQEKLKDLTTEVLKLARIISEAPGLQKFIINYIPDSAQKLAKDIENYKKNNEEIFNKISFKHQFENLAKYQNKSRHHYHNLEFKQAKNYVIECLKIYEGIKKTLKYEISYSKVFRKNYDLMINEKKKIIDEKDNQIKKFKNINNSNSKIPHEAIERFNKIKEKLNELDLKENFLNESVSDKTISHSSKIHRMKIFLIFLSKLTEEINAFKNLIWLIDNKNINIREKFKKIQILITDLIFDVKNEGIKIRVDYQNKLSEISDKISIISKQLTSNDISHNTEKKLSKIFEDALKIYSIVGGELQVSNVAKDLIKKLSTQRSLNENIDATIALSEKEYMDGNYYDSLNCLIRYMEEKDVRI